ncbi:MAG: hypothetical protein IKH26_00795 [Bacteroidaceae bacterium]|nr:hypothetical protein [Bacteroidaceae bacterium]
MFWAVSLLSKTQRALIYSSFQGKELKGEAEAEVAAAVARRAAVVVRHPTEPGVAAPTATTGHAALSILERMFSSISTLA